MNDIRNLPLHCRTINCDMVEPSVNSYFTHRTVLKHCIKFLVGLSSICSMLLAKNLPKDFGRAAPLKKGRKPRHKRKSGPQGNFRGLSSWDKFFFRP